MSYPFFPPGMPEEMTMGEEARLEAQLDDLTDHEFWLLVNPGEASEVHWWANHCYRCARRSTVWWCVTTPPWSESRPEQDTAVIAAVLSDCENFPEMAYLEFRTTRPVPEGYMAFCCPHCKAVFGDFYLFTDLQKLIAAGKTNIVSVSI